MAELLYDFLAKPIPIVPQLIGRGILPKQGRLVLGGEPKSNKSWIALELALAMAQGRAAFSAVYKSGTPVLPVTGKYRILYIEQEIGETELQKRLTSLMTGQDALGIDFYVKSKDLEMRLDTPEGHLAIAREVEQVKPDCLILDPLAKFHLSGENSSQEMGAVLRVGQHLTQDYNSALIYVHHTSKPNPENPRRGGDRLRGSSAIFADVDTCVIVERKSSESNLEPVIELDIEMRCGEPLPKLYVQRLRSGQVVYLGEDYRWQGDRVGMTGESGRRSRVYDPTRR
jgi:RecA-family ATPase